MDEKFVELTHELPTSLERLLACKPVRATDVLPRSVPERAVYLFSQGSSNLYVGRTNRLRARYREHCRGRHNDAPFAFKMARYDTKMHRAKGSPTRKELEAHPLFMPAFIEAKLRIGSMDFRWVEEKDPNKQCLLEIYATITLAAKYNDFENH